MRLRALPSVLFLLVFAPSAWACGDETCSPEEGVNAHLGLARSTCNEPACGPFVCAEFTNLPFQRLSASVAAPIHEVGCFAVAKKQEGFYLLINDDGDEFTRELSRDGIDWLAPSTTNGDLATESWALGGVQCPDPRFEADGSITMFYNARVERPGNPAQEEWAIALATSTDLGVSWTMHSDVIVKPTDTHYPYMPSAVKLADGRTLLAYSWVCRGSVTAGAETHLLESTDGVNFSALSVPAMLTGGCADWDDGSANRVRLIVDPNGNDLHLLYSGYPWDPTVYGGTGGPTRQCAGIGFASSFDGGLTWCKATTPVFQHTHGGVAGWDNLTVVKPTWTWEKVGGATKLRLFYEGRGSGGAGAGLGIAQADWPLNVAYQGVCPMNAGGGNPIGPGSDQGLTLGSIDGVRITSVPNPSIGTTMIGLQLSGAERHGSADLTIFDVTGRRVQSLWSGDFGQAPAELQWDGRAGDGANVAPGRYLVRLRVAGETVGTHWITRLR